jgi:hypothetical protein
MDNQEKERVFDPLFRAVAKLDLTPAELEEVICNYMFMYEDKGIFAYKHSLTRQYVYLDESGTLQGGVLNTGDYSSPPLQD